MNVTLKALVVAAVATMSVSGAAHADTLNGTNSNLYFSLMDTSTKSSVLINLGNAPGFADFDSSAVNAVGYTHTWDLSSYTDLVNNFSSVLNSSTVTWGIFTASNAVSNGAKRLVATVNTTDATTLKNPLSANIGTDTGALQSFVSQASNINSIYYSALSLKNPQTPAVFGSKGILGSNTLNVATTTVDGILGVAEYTSGATPTARFFENQYGATTFKFDSNYKLTLTAGVAPTAAVPEAGTSSMMLVGLGLMGWVATRRKHQA